MDEKVGGEAQVCRLCGQFESIYIDVFGDEGTRRLLGLKIHSKINIVIDETDPLPKTICVQCLGKLEFVCDFQEECLRTQRLLRDRYHLPPLPDLIKEDDELPKTVCIRCIGTLEFLCDFVEVCQETQHKLKEKEDAKPSPSTIPSSEIDKEFNKENVISSKRKSLSPPAPRKSKTPVASPSHDLENISPSSEAVQFVPEISENVLSEIPHMKNQKSANAQKQIPKIRSFTILGNARRSLPPKSEGKPLQKTLRRSSPNSLRNPEEKLEKSAEPPKVEIVALAPRSVSAPKPVEIRRSLQKFIRDPEEFSLAPTATPKIVRSPEKPEEVDRTPKKIEEGEGERQEPLKEADTSVLEVVDAPEVAKKIKETSPEQSSEELQPQDDELLNKTSISTTSESPAAPEPKESLDSLKTAVESEVKPQEVEAKTLESRLKPQSSTESSSEEPEVALSVGSSTEADHSKTEETKTPAPRISRSLSEPQPKRAFSTVSSSSPSETQELRETMDCSQNNSNAQDNQPRLKRSRSSSGASRPFFEGLFLKTTSRSSSSPPLKATHDYQNSEPSSESRRRNRSSSESSSSSVLTSTSSSSKRRKSGAIYGTISQLISSEEKEAIETFYIIDMSVVDESAVEKNLNHLDRKQTMCLICSAVYPRIDKCRVHIWGHLEMKPYKCTACDFSTVTITNIRCHIRKSHLKIKPFECNFCKKRYVTAVLLEEHLNTHSGLRPFKCTVCAFSSASRQVLSYHMTTHKPVKDVTCEICGKEFFSKGRMRAHMITHNKNRKLMCKYCSHHFSSAEALERHLENVHSRDYVCDVCGKATKSRKALHNHQNVHSEAKFKCSLCPNVYKSGHILKEHLLKHEGIRKYKCDICEKDFAQQSHLAAHMAVHSEKRFKCPGCQRAFNRHDNMKIHTKRCGMFKAKPELQEQLNKRVKRAKVVQIEGVEGAQEMEEMDDMDMDVDDGDDDDDQPAGTFRIGQVMVIPIAEREGEECRVQEPSSVRESVIGLECF